MYVSLLFTALSRLAVSSASVGNHMDPQYWHSLAPDLHIFDAAYSNSVAFLHADNGAKAYLRELIKSEGYIQLDGISFSPMALDSLVQTVEALHKQGLPPPFAYVYDEFWLIFIALDRVIESLIGPGYHRLPDFWVWRVNPQEEEAGWGFHRDKKFRTIDENGLPLALTVWIPLNAATTLNGCMYMLPADRDPTYNQLDSDGINLNSSLPLLDIISSFRALPVNAGSVLMWNQQVYHYGSRSSKRGAAPRVSVAVEFQSGAIQPLNLPLFNPLSLPTFEDRLQLIAKQIMQYKHMYPLDDETFRLAQNILKQVSINVTRL